MAHRIEFSFLIPVFNSVGTLQPLYKGIEDLMAEINSPFEVIFIEDNGAIKSWETLLQIRKEHPENVTLIKLTKNFGQNGATLCGIDQARGEFLITLDDDLQVHPSELKKLIDYQRLHQSEVVYGVYDEQGTSAIRKAGSKYIKKIFTETDGGSNIGSAIRLINANIAKHLRNHSQDHLFINQVISWYTFDTKFVEVARNPRHEGKSGYNLFQLFYITFQLFFLYTSAPLKIMISLCIISSVTTFGLASYYIYQHFVLGRGLGFLAVIVVSISLILASISIMGVYINRIYSARVKKPNYVIKVKI
jgi:glycosyltransferase involved in cell wall biosynthesis